jgi:hypothetical protein
LSQALPPAEGEFVRELTRAHGRVIVIALRDCSDAEQERVANVSLQVLKRQLAPFCVIMDMSHLFHYPATQRALYGAAREQLRPLFERLHRMTAYVVTNAEQRGFVTAVGWKAPVTTATRVYVETFAEALAACDRALPTER